MSDDALINHLIKALEDSAKAMDEAHESLFTQVFDSYKKVKKEYEAPEDLYISQLTEDYTAINKIYAEFKNEFHGPYFEIHKLRQQLKSLSNGNT